jgi:hypothetical protein
VSNNPSCKNPDCPFKNREVFEGHFKELYDRSEWAREISWFAESYPELQSKLTIMLVVALTNGLREQETNIDMLLKVIAPMVIKEIIEGVGKEKTNE